MARPARDEDGRGDRLRDVADHYPVVIIGGGINGCGLFRDLCLQGVDVLLVEKGDYCSGASAAPSRLIHGGIKYLETGEFRLVKQSLVERNLLLKNAPHLVHPLPTVLPIRSWLGGTVASALRFFGRPARMADRGAVITEIGLRLYDLFGRHFQVMPTHSFWGRGRALAEMPDLDPTIKAAGLYYEARISHAERLGLELILDGVSEHPGSRALNYVSADGVHEGRLVLRDEQTGAETAVSADIVVNAAGAWIDKVNHRLGVTSSHMGGTKGSHIVVRNARLLEALRGRMIYFGSADGRVNLLYPFMGNVLIGSTDIPVPDPDLAVCTREEEDYLTRIVSEVFPKIPVERSDIVYNYCGVRPLPRSEGVDPGLVSRDHSIAEDRADGGQPVLSLIGGKWTTFRGFAEEAADLVLGRLGRQRTESTKARPIGGGRQYPDGEAARVAFVKQLADRTGLPQDYVGRLFSRYGTTSAEVATHVASRQRGDEVSPGYFGAELEWIAANEHVIHLDDVLFRRTDLALAGRLTSELIGSAARILARELGWSQERVDAEVERTRAAGRAHSAPVDGLGGPTSRGSAATG